MTTTQACNLKAGQVIELPSRLGFWRVVGKCDGPMQVDLELIGCVRCNLGYVLSVQCEPSRRMNIRS